MVDVLKFRKMRNLWYLVACGELSSLLALLAKKSYKSKQIKQIYFEKFEKDLYDFCHEVTLNIRHLELAKLEVDVCAIIFIFSFPLTKILSFSEKNEKNLIFVKNLNESLFLETVVFLFEVGGEDAFAHSIEDFLLCPEATTVEFIGGMDVAVIDGFVDKDEFALTS